MCQQLWNVMLQAAPVDGAGWYGEVIDHGSAVDDQVLVDVLGELAWVQVGNLGNFAASAELAERSHALAEAKQVQPSSLAWLALSQSENYSGAFAESLRSAQLACRAAEARQREDTAVLALCTTVAALAALGELDATADTSVELLRRADLWGHPIYTSAAVITVAGTNLWGCEVPNYEASLDVLARYDLQLSDVDLNGLWHEIMWGATLLGLDRPGAVDRLARAARAADRLNTWHALDLALRQLAIAAAEAGLARPAVGLVAYTEAHLVAYRIQNSGQARVQARLDDAVAGLGEPPPTATPHRGEMLAFVNEIEAAFARAESDSALAEIDSSNAQ